MIESIKHNIGLFLERGDIELSSPNMFPINDFEEAVKEFGFTRVEDDEPTNGWQVDFWYKFENPKYTYQLQLSGSLWYGNFNVTKVNE